MSRFFIDRPIFAWVIAIAIMVFGALSILALPIAQYPSIAPTSISITANYPGASASTVVNTVTQVIEEQMKGIDKLSYLSSTSDSTGSSIITLTFDEGTDPDIAQVQVQNKLQLATPLLPAEVQQQGITVVKAVKNFLLVVGLESADGSISGPELGDYIASYIQDPVSRVTGVGDTQLFGSQHAMRIWLDPGKLNSYKLTPGDVNAAIVAQNVQVAAGQLGALPVAAGQQLNATVNSQSRLQTPDQFRKILLRTGQGAATVYLSDVARVELGIESYTIAARYNGLPASGLAIKLAVNANAISTAAGVRKELALLQRNFPPGVKAVFPYDTTPFVTASIKEVVKTLFEAIALVFAVMYLFLQSFRATLVPTIAVPVVLLGTFGVLNLFGYSINTLSMLALVLAIGLLVDDAIVVVESVERNMEEGASPRDAAIKSMEQITSALVGIALVLSAVFVPMAFYGGASGVIYRQFSVTIVAAMLLSVFVAVVLTPALCATLLKAVPKKDLATQRGFFGWFNRLFDRANKGYGNWIQRFIKLPWTVSLVFAGIVAMVVLLFARMPTGFLPDEDQGIIFVQIQLPVGAVQSRATAVLEQVEDYFKVKEKAVVEAMFTVAGFSFSGSGENTALGFIKLKDWSLRGDNASSVKAILKRANAALAKIGDAKIYVVEPAAVIELGNSTGFDMYLEDQAGVGHEGLLKARAQLLGLAAKNPGLMAVRPNDEEDTPQLQVDIDQPKAGADGLALGDINDTIGTAWGGTYVNQFVDKDRVKKVFVQGDAVFRMLPDDLNQWYVRNASGSMVPFSAFSTSHWTYGSPLLERYNSTPAVEILGQEAPGKSSGDALKTMESLADKLPKGFGIEWTGLSFQERLAGSQTLQLYAMSLLVVFLCLAALYESWSIPFAVLLVVPLGVLGALAATTLRGLDNDVFFQVSLLTTVGLSAKNAILIVEYAEDLIAQGKETVAAVLEAAHLRLRPILMTSIAFGLGTVPLAISTGAGAASRSAIGTGVIGGMLTGTILCIFFVPLFFVAIRRVFKSQAKPAAQAAGADGSVARAAAVPGS
jgi:multidrug efflux pump